MYRLWRILLAILWRRLAMAVETKLVSIITKGLAIFEDEDSRFDLQHNQSTRARISASLIDAHRKVDLLIRLRALEIAGLPWTGPTSRPAATPIIPTARSQPAGAAFTG